ncbi:SEC-C motif-containing protein [Alkalibacterium subtropicum]|uniref:SEC-C motif-containing protein n=1 Tax=Alkalibacterium subtropicum TaxID=753702 RepID=A0A1I1J6J7_9LACT|nr:SEC-C metal-binding domain-containing protein [Alkalibacterium subtropicum]SFC44066.1 SEC-C motif-containing protein [Alkalibacterium subtropicum]
MNLLSQYIVASAHLYGAVPKAVVADIYNDQNEEQVMTEDVEKCYLENRQAIEKTFVYLEDEHFAHETVLTFDGLDAMLQQQAGKPRYIPEKEELLKYVDDFYFEQNSAYTTIYHYVLENLLDGDDDRATDVCEDVQGMIEVNARFKSLMNIFDHRGVTFQSRKQRETVSRMVKVLQNNVRLWDNNGHTNKELKEQGYTVSAVPSENKASSQTKKLGRNDPCHCGSGKKYKKCCLDKDQKMNARQV